MLVLTGQHPGLAPADHGLAGLPCHELHCAGLDDPMAHADLVAARLASLLLCDPPDMVVVQGDTSSALGGALAARQADIALAHVEAGLRTHDRTMPWPEEGNRITIDAVADLLFPPTRCAAKNLFRDKVQGEIHITGNTGIDALQAMLATMSPARPRPANTDAPLDLLVTCHRRENWGGGLISLAVALVQLAAEGSATADVVSIPTRASPRQCTSCFAASPEFACRPQQATARWSSACAAPTLS